MTVTETGSGGPGGPARCASFAVPASDIRRSRRFYEDVLGLAADDTVPSRIYFHCGEVIVAVIDWAVEPPASFGPTPEHLYFATGDLDHAHERAATAGAGRVTPIETRPWGERSFHCLDPDGNRLCFVDESTLFLGRGADWS
jgi:predicted enzyme related to lactoylglutathione lyase